MSSRRQILPPGVAMVFGDISGCCLGRNGWQQTMGIAAHKRIV